MSAIYELIGRLVVGIVRWRYGDQIKAAAIAGAGLAAIAAAAYVAARASDEEGA